FFLGVEAKAHRVDHGAVGSRLKNIYARDVHDDENCGGRLMLKIATMIRKLENMVKAPRSAFCLLLSVYCLLFSSGCRRDMQDQPKMKPFRSTTFFGDGLSARPLIE